MAREKVFAVIGLGTFGRRVCEVLAEKGGKVLAIDVKPDLVEKVKNIVTQAVLLDSTDEEALSLVPFEDVAVAVVAMGDNIEASIITTALLKRIGIPYIVARAVSDIHQQVLRQIGADEVINIEIDQGQRLAQRLISPEVLDRIPITESISLAELYVPKPFIGDTLEKLDLRKKMRVNIVSIRRVALSVDEEGNPVKNETIVFPEAGEVLLESDLLFVVGKNEDIDNFKDY
ncbi:MAG: TrkA family potassium uptake protein [Spirochaetales bacterium]|nr:TrkA family potassium uptake protein [Spirochaetales bacterium]